MRQDVSLHDRYDLSKETVLLNGTQALVRLMLTQAARDKAAGYNTAGYVTGYRGSPLGAVDMQMQRASKDLEEAQVRFEPGLNEDLAATAVWGTQNVGLRDDAKYEGVFSLWYGKGPGVDRSGDAFRHGNLAGSAARGGVVLALGDDHTGESSTTCHQSDWAMLDAYVPVLSPAGVQEIIDFGLYGFALSRYSGLWTGLKLMKDTVEATSVIDGRVDRMMFVTPDNHVLPEDGLNIRLGDHWVPQEERLVKAKRFAAEAFARANGIDRRVWGKPGAKIGVAAAGKNWLDVQHALNLLGLDAEKAERLGLTTYKIGQSFPLDLVNFRDWARDLDLIVIVEEKRKLIEVQVKEAMFDDTPRPRVYGWFKGGSGGLGREELFPSHYALDPVTVAQKLAEILEEEGRGTDEILGRLENLKAASQASENTPGIATRTPYYCSGCPHNTSTKLPEGSRGGAGIGCHTMVLWMDRETYGLTHMGAEGANWIGEGPFSETNHIFQNMGDGTYNHSGMMAIRAALASDVNITYKILYNDAVAMTGGQAAEGGQTPDRIAKELVAMGVGTLAVVFDEKEEPNRSDFPSEVSWHPRSEMPAVQRRLRDVKGVSVILYVQTCAAEKRRRRKRGTFPDPDKRIFIDTDVCEGCGDCGVQSNCVSIVPVETELGRKRAIDQSSCNKDFTCMTGFCPSFVTVEGGVPRKAAGMDVDVGGLPEPTIPAIDGTHNVVVTGIGGTGVVTVGATLAMAAHLDGKGAGMMEMAGLAQKGGAVQIHVRLANQPQDIAAIRVATGEADTLIGGDLVVSAGPKTLGLTTTGRTKAVVNTHEVMTGEFTRDTAFRIPGDRLQMSLEARLKTGLTKFDATALADKVLGDAIYTNVLLLGAVWQAGQLPVSGDALRAAIRLNGVNVETNLKAFETGRWAASNPERVEELLAEDQPKERTLEEKIAFRADHLEAYQSARLAKRYRKLVDPIEQPALKEAVAKGYHKLLSYKDEYEVARLMTSTREKAEAAFEGDLKLTYHLAPPVLSGEDAEGRPRKKNFGAWTERLWPVLARLKWLRKTPFDPFGYTAERRMERRLIREFEQDMKRVLASPEKNLDAAIALAELPLEIRGFGPVKAANAERASKTRTELLEAFKTAESLLAAE